MNNKQAEPSSLRIQDAHVLASPSGKEGGLEQELRRYESIIRFTHSPPKEQGSIRLANLESLVTVANRTRKPILHYVSIKESSSNEVEDPKLTEHLFYLIDSGRFYIYKSTVIGNRSAQTHKNKKRLLLTESTNSSSSSSYFVRKHLVNYKNIVMLTSVPPGKDSGEAESLSIVVRSFDELSQLADALEKPIMFYTETGKMDLPQKRWEEKRGEEDLFYVFDGGMFYVFNLNSPVVQSSEHQRIIQEILQEKNSNESTTHDEARKEIETEDKVTPSFSSDANTQYIDTTTDVKGDSRVRNILSRFMSMFSPSRSSFS